jgi:hypothetical protein
MDQETDLEQAALSAQQAELWELLVAAATLGTERRAWAAPPAEGPLGAALARLDPADQEGALLGAAALLASYRRAGRTPTALSGDAPAAPSPAPEDDRRECPPLAVQHLQSILNGAYRAVLPEWLAAVAAAGLRIPSGDLPDLLEIGRATSSLRPLIRTVIGARGGWLAAQNPDWDYAKTEDPELRVALSGQSSAAAAPALQAQWETGSRITRLALLEALRATQPELARGLVQQSWSGERAEDRAAFLERFAQGLSMADEPFLETALDDRSKEVRRVAADLLTRLPESRLVGRMVARLQPLLRWTPGEPARLLGIKPARLAAIEVALPEGCDKAMARDGISPKPSPHHDLGERGVWLMQLISAVPPATWSAAWGARPAEIVAAAQQSEWKSALLDGWTTATMACGDPDWAEALLQADPERVNLGQALPPERLEALLVPMLRGDCVPLHRHPALSLLRQAEHPWSLKLGHATLDALYRHMRQWTKKDDYLLHSALQEFFALRLPAELVQKIADGWPDQKHVRERWQPAMDRLLITMQFRQDMLAVLRV